jgi:transposase
VPACLHKGAIGVSGYKGQVLRNFGLKVGIAGVRSSKHASKSWSTTCPLADLVQPLLAVRWVLREQIGILHRRLLAVVRKDEVCSRLITIPGVGLVVALTYRATVDVPARFCKSKSVGAGLRIDLRQVSGEIDRSGRISRRGVEMKRGHAL